MRPVYSIIASLPIVATAGVGDAKCSGNACSAAYLTKQNGCMVVVNNSDRPVKFSHGVGHAPTVYPHSSEVVLTIQAAMHGGDECMRSIGRHTITFAD